ncbi:hypothetical protein PFI50_09675 [Mycobacterium xenopi]|uniref:Uncharacterized protein n=1 Tax=Mycobacterium xenopi 4042 TaxID=1299334 RepID=X8AFD6_MYCXE|nr:hypothetical protein [Mycobacterium xenopi]EUA30627.1 hypothetical protein I553_4884 [Mycobacterium xenopi 4042]EUA51399.1 hypothetical protein I552_2340 [Mycobacterium xenopi 3993]MDA3639684.1 hypothetical protein [Mycobacterium xenopi]
MSVFGRAPALTAPLSPPGNWQWTVPPRRTLSDLPASLRAVES